MVATQRFQSPLHRLLSVTGNLLERIQRCTSLAAGDSFRLGKAFTEEEVLAFAQITGDSNPIHVDPKAASRHGFPRCILPGMLSASLFPAIIGSEFPGAVYVKQDLNFRHPVMIGDSLFAEVSVLKVSRHRVVFSTICQDAQGKVVVHGTALALLPNKSSEPQA